MHEADSRIPVALHVRPLPGSEHRFHSGQYVPGRRASRRIRVKKTENETCFLYAVHDLSKKQRAAMPTRGYHSPFVIVKESHLLAHVGIVAVTGLRLQMGLADLKVVTGRFGVLVVIHAQS